MLNSLIVIEDIYDLRGQKLFEVRWRRAKCLDPVDTRPAPRRTLAAAGSVGSGRGGRAAQGPAPPRRVRVSNVTQIRL